MLLMSACESECEQAAALLDSCRDEIGAQVQASGRNDVYVALPITHVDTNDCSGDNLCRAECLNEADCAAIAMLPSTATVTRTVRPVLPSSTLA